MNTLGEANGDGRAFPFIRLNQRAAKPRQQGLTEIRGPYYAVMGTRYLSDILETVGEYVDGVKYAGGSFALMPRARVREINDLTHKYNAYVSTGGFIEHVLAHEGAAAVTRDVRWVIGLAGRCLDAGAERIMIESEGITESVTTWRTDAVAAIIDGLGLAPVMFEAADPKVFEWYIKNYGAEVNLFVDHSQIVQLECLRAGLWGTKSSWGRITTYKP